MEEGEKRLQRAEQIERSGEPHCELRAPARYRIPANRDRLLLAHSPSGRALQCAGVCWQRNERSVCSTEPSVLDAS